MEYKYKNDSVPWTIIGSEYVWDEQLGMSVYGQGGRYRRKLPHVF